MVDSKRYDPTITRFQKHTKSFVSGKTKKGHLNKEERENGDVIKEEGILISVDGRDLLGKTWKVRVGQKDYMCSYGDNIIYLPECTKNGNFYFPKSECRVEISIDKKSKINTIIRIKDPTKQPIAMIDKQISLQGNGNASLTVEENKTTIAGDGLSVENDIEIDTSNDDSISADKISITELYKTVQIIQTKLSEDNDSRE